MTRRRTIGQLAREVGVGVETIRFYERIGLIDQPRSDAGPRHYDDGVLARVKYIRLAQQMGLSLKAIQGLQRPLAAGEPFCASLRATVERRLLALAQEAAELARMQGDLRAFLDRCRARDPHLACPIVEQLTRRGGVAASAVESPPWA